MHDENDIDSDLGFKDHRYLTIKNHKDWLIETLILVFNPPIRFKNKKFTEYLISIIATLISLLQMLSLLWHPNLKISD